MNTTLLFEMLEEHEKSNLYFLLYEWKKKKVDAKIELNNNNNDILDKWSNGKISNRLRNALLDYYDNYEMTIDLLEGLDLYEVKRIRNTGPTSIKEFQSYRKSEF